jgi:colicin import membrane protein
MNFIKENWSAILFTVFVHVVVLALFAANIDFERKVIKPEKKVAVQAVVINGAALYAEIKRQEKLDQEKIDAEVNRQKELDDRALQAKKAREAEEKRLADLAAERKKQAALDKKVKQDARKKAELEKKRLADLEKKRKAEEANLEKIKAEQLATKKKAAEEQKALDAAIAKKKAEEAANKKAAELAAKKKAEEEAKKKAAADAEAKRLAELEAALASELAEEEAFTDAVDSGAMNRYILAISQSIERNWRKPPSAPDNLKCILNVKQLPGGDVGQLSFGACNADEATKDSIEQAVFRASPLPEPEDPSLFTRNLEIIFEPEN